MISNQKSATLVTTQLCLHKYSNLLFYNNDIYCDKYANIIRVSTNPDISLIKSSYHLLIFNQEKTPPPQLLYYIYELTTCTTDISLNRIFLTFCKLKQ